MSENASLVVDAEAVRNFVDQNGGIIGITLEKLERFRKEHAGQLGASGQEELSRFINIELFFGDGD